jgi:Ser/Thr protein kinase RdoA (MazF antagonist)
MDTSENYIQRILDIGSLNEFIVHVVNTFQLGELVTFSIITIGYEDLNIKVITTKSTYFIKCFGSFRDEKDCKRCVDILTSVVQHGICHPKLYSLDGSFLHTYVPSSETLWYCVMDYIDGKSFYELNMWPTREEKLQLIIEAGKINSLDIIPEDYYDEWSPINFLKEYSEKKQYVLPELSAYMDKFAKVFSKIDMSSLSHAFVHGDIIRANVIRDSSSKLYIVDFAKASQKPRLQELSVLLCGMFVNGQASSDLLDDIVLVKREYVPVLSKYECEALHLFVIAVFAMYAMLGEYSRVVRGMNTKENQYWINLGNTGLRYCSTQWNIF